MVLGIAGAGIAGAAGLGIGATIGGVVGFKIGAATERHKLSFSTLNIEVCTEYNDWLYNLLSKDFDYSETDAKAFVAYAGFHAEANNPFLEPTGINILNTFSERSKRGTESALNHVVNQQFIKEMEPTLAIAIKDGAVTQDTDSLKLQFSATKQLSRSQVLMEFYRNILAVLYLDLTQTINKTPNSEADIKDLSEKAEKKVFNIIEFILKAHATILDDRNSFFAKVVKKGIFHTKTARQKALTPQMQKINAYLESEINKATQSTHEYQAGGGAKSAAASVDAEDTPLLPVFIIREALQKDYENKKAILEAEALAKQARSLSEKADVLVGDFASKTYSSATTADGYMSLSSVTVKLGSMYVKDTVLRDSRAQPIDNLPFVNYVFNGRSYNKDTSKEDFFALPYTDLEVNQLYKAHGAVGGSGMLPSVLKTPSAQSVRPEDAGRAALVLADINFLTAMNEKFSDAYQYEVSYGQGAKSPMAHYLLLQQKVILNQIKVKFEDFFRHELVVQTVNRALHKYQEKHHGFTPPLAAKKVKVSGSGDVSSAEVDIFSFLGNSSDAAALVIKEITSTEGLFLFSDMRQTIARLQQLTELNARLVSQVDVDPELTTDMAMDPHDPRAVALQLQASIAAQSPERPLPIKQSLQGWSKDLKEAISILDGSEQSKAVKEIATKNERQVVAFQALLVSAYAFVSNLNTAYPGLTEDKKKELASLVKKGLGPYLSFNVGKSPFSLNEQHFVSAYDYVALLSSFNVISASLASSLPAASNGVQASLKAYAQLVDDAGISTYTQAQMKSMHAGKQSAYAYAEKVSAQQVIRLETSLEQTRAQLQESQQKLSESLETEEMIKSRLKTIEETLAESKVTIEKTEAVLAASQTETAALKQTLVTTNANLETATDQAKTTLQSYDELCGAMLEEIQSQKSFLVQLGESLRKNHSDHMTKLKENYVASVQVAKALPEGDAKVAMLENLEKDYNELSQSAKQAFLNAKEDMQSQVEKMTLKITAYIKTINGLSEESNKVVAALQTIPSELEAVITQMSALERNLKNLASDVDKLRENIAEVSAEVVTIRQKLSAPESEKKKDLSMEGNSGTLPTITLNHKVGTKAYAAKNEAINTQLDTLQTALKALKICEKGELTAVAKNTKLKAMNALVSAFYMAHIHRNHVIEAMAGSTKSSVSLAKALLPTDAIKKRGLVSLLRDHIKVLQDKYENREFSGIRMKLPNSLSYLRDADINELVSNDSKHRLTPARLARIMKDMVVYQYGLKYSGQKPSFTGGGAMINVTNWSGLVEKVSIEVEGDFAHRNAGVKQPVVSGVASIARTEVITSDTAASQADGLKELTTKSSAAPAVTTQVSPTDEEGADEDKKGNVPGH